jgi:predicted signal transduction protein with EAL and GGDEF domain
MIMLARAILGELNRPVALRIGRVSISACAGIAERATRSATSAAMLADADAALYRAKSRGPGHWAIAGVPGDTRGLHAG